MKSQLLVAAGLLVVGGGVTGYLLTRPKPAPHHPPPPGRSEHAAGVDRAMISVLTMYRASEGPTPCESAYIAFKSSMDVAVMYKAKEAILDLAPKEEFLKKCNEFTPAEQKCIVPLYRLRHQDECKTVRPSAERLKPIVVERAPQEFSEPTEPGADPAAARK